MHHSPAANNNHNASNNNRCAKNEKLSKNNNGNIKRTNLPGRQHHQHHRRSHFNPASDSFIYERCTDTLSTSTADEAESTLNLSSGGSSDADDEDDITKSAYPSTRRNIKKRLQANLNNNNNNYTELRQPNRMQQPSANSTATSGKRFYAMAASRFAQEDMVFTENQIYIGLKEMMNAQNSTATNRGQKLIDKRPFNVVSNMDTQNQGIQKNYAKSFHDSGLGEQILFEKVKYDKNKRYLQTSPVSTNSSSSRVMQPETDPISYRAFLNDPTVQTRTSSMYVDDERDTTFTQQWAPPAGGRASSQHHQPRPNARRLRNEVGDDATWQLAYDNDAGYVEQNSILDNHRNRIRSTTPPPPATSPPSLDALLNNNQSYYYERASASFSRRSSISTTETWVDDESFDNSFNEELEKRCEVFAR